MFYSTSTLLTRNLDDVFGKRSRASARGDRRDLYRRLRVLRAQGRLPWPRRDRSHRGRDQGYSPRLSISANCRARGIGQWWADPMGIGPPWRGASLRRDRFHHRPRRSDCGCLSLFRRATLNWTLPCDVLQRGWRAFEMRRNGLS